MRPRVCHPLPLFALVALGVCSSALAQTEARPGHRAVSAPTDSTRDAKKPRILELNNYGPWSRITSASLSADGRWIVYVQQPNDGDATLFAKQVDGGRVDTVSVGPPPAARGGGFGAGGASAPVLSDDSRWVGYYVNPPQREGRRGRSSGPGGQGRPAGGGAAQRPTRRFELLDLDSGTKFSVPNAASFKLSKGSAWLAVRVNHESGDTSRSSGDLILRELATGVTRNIGNVDLYEFDDSGSRLAYTVDATERLGNGVYLIDLANGQTRALSSATQDFAQLTWSNHGTHLAALRGDKAKEKKHRDNVLLAWTDVGNPRERAVEYDPTTDASFPKGMVVSEFGALRWSKDGTRLFLGIKEQESDPEADDEPAANVDVWHWKDTEIQSVQIVRLQQARRFTYTSVLDVRSKKFLRLADDDMRAVQPTADDRWAIGRLDTVYRGEVAWGGTRADYYRVNVATGERTLIDDSLTRTMGTSPDGQWFLYLKNERVQAFNLESGKSLTIDDGTGQSFVDREDDHAYERPVYGVGGWSSDGRSVLLYHKFDIWRLPLDGTKPTNLTHGVGDAQQVRFRIERFGAGGRRGGRFAPPAADDEDDDGIDLSKPLILSAYGEWTKKSGYWQLSPDKEPKPLMWDDAMIGQAEKAADADRVIFTRQTFTEFPDYWATTTTFKSPRRMTDANPQLAEYAWGSKVLIDYANGKGQRLQATLTLPAGYEQGKRYPMLVYFYELMSNQHHRFSMPVYDDRPHMSAYASDGYLVLQPDVVYEIGQPGTSALDCVTSAVKKVIELGYADPAHIGLQGHSWGGYESSFIVTQTDLFAAVVTGAPPTNLVSFYDLLYKSTGTVHHGIMEVGQVRMGRGVTPWTDHELYMSQSPVHHVQQITTPLLILHGTDDGAVDWVQGLEFYNAARRWGKPVILLSYPGEPHHLARKENQKDFQIRMKQFFDHYLKGAPAPHWMTDGVPQTRKGGPIQ